MMEQMFHDDDGDDDEIRRFLDEHGGELQDHVALVAEDLAAIGVYIDTVTFHIDPAESGVDVILHGALQDVAFSDRVQRKEQVVFDEAFEGITEMLIDEDYERARWELRDDDE